MTDAKALMPLAEVTSRLRILGQHDAGLRTIPIASIIGSVDRTVDFDRFFRTSRRELRRRLDALRAAFADREMPPISVYEAGGVHFVIDGHHRVALSRELGSEYIDAEATHRDWRGGSTSRPRATCTCGPTRSYVSCAP